MVNNKSIYIPIKPSLVRRIGAYLLDAIIFLVLLTGFALLLSTILQYDKTNNIVNDYFIKYGIKIYDEENNLISQTDSKLYSIAWNEFYEDIDATKAWGLLVKKSIITILGSTFLSLLVLELIIPCLLKQGRSIGRFILKIALINKSGIRIHFRELFVRFLFGKVVVNFYIPIICALLIYFGNNSIYLWIIILAVMLANIYCYLGTKLHQTLPDYIGMCYKCDYDQQIFFDNLEELNKAKGKEDIIKNKNKKY